MRWPSARSSCAAWCQASRASRPRVFDAAALGRESEFLGTFFGMVFQVPKLALLLTLVGGGPYNPPVPEEVERRGLPMTPQKNCTHYYSFFMSRQVVPLHAGG